MRRLKCLRCGDAMQFGKQEKIQLGQTGFLFGDWPNLLAGALEVEIYFCPKCGKMEFYMPGFPVEEVQTPQMEEDSLPPDAQQDIVGVSMEGIPQIRCPACGTEHDFDYPRCPRCDYPY